MASRQIRHCKEAFSAEEAILQRSLPSVRIKIASYLAMTNILMDLSMVAEHSASDSYRIGRTTLLFKSVDGNLFINKMIQQNFALQATETLKNDPSVIGLAVGGSWLSNEIDTYSDLDLILVTTEKVSAQKSKMLQYANQLGEMISAFTGEHVGEPRVLICLYDNPLLHVDIKFLTLDEFASRVENPTLLIDRDDQLKQILHQTEAKFPYPDYQWIEDRFWTWMHYAMLKIGRGEYLEAFDFFGFLRMVVFGPLLHIKNNNLPRGVRKVETQLNPDDFNQLKSTIASYNKASLIASLENAIELYKSLRAELYTNDIQQNDKAEAAVIKYLATIK